MEPLITVGTAGNEPGRTGGTDGTGETENNRTGQTKNRNELKRTAAFLGFAPRPSCIDYSRLFLATAIADPQALVLNPPVAA